MNKLILVILVFSTGISFLNAQKIQSFSIAFTNESIAMPFTRYKPLHPGIKLGATVWENEKKISHQQFRVNLSGYYHRKVETGFYLDAQYLHIFKLKDILGLDVSAGLGYLHSFYPGELYEQNGETGEFEQINQYGRPHFQTNVGIGLRYIRHPLIEPFIRQELLIETPFANTIPAIAHSFLNIGVNIKINSNENN